MCDLGSYICRHYFVFLMIVTSHLHRPGDSPGRPCPVPDGPLKSLVCYVPSLRYTGVLGCHIHCGVDVTESSTNKQHLLSAAGSHAKIQLPIEEQCMDVCLVITQTVCPNLG